MQRGGGRLEVRSQVRGGDNDELCFFFPAEFGGHGGKGGRETHAVDAFELLLKGVTNKTSVLVE